jgi:hypothetical protein
MRLAAFTHELMCQRGPLAECGRDGHGRQFAGCQVFHQICGIRLRYSQLLWREDAALLGDGHDTVRGWDRL